MNELSYQIDVSHTFNYSDTEEASSGEENLEQENISDIQLELCHACSQSLPIELEDCLQRWKMLLFNSISGLRKLRNINSNLKKKLGQSQSTLAEKNSHISQLEEAIQNLGAKIEATTDEAERKSRDLAELHQKLNENYRLVAELSSDNLRLATEKAAAEQLLEEVKHEQSLIKGELGKAQKVIQDSMASGNFQDHWAPPPRPRQSSPETSASSFDFFPPSSPASIRNQQRRRGSIPPRGRQKSNRKWNKQSGASSDYASETSPRKRSNSRPNTALPASDVSSPDLGVDLGSDPFSSLERSNAQQGKTFVI